MYSWEYATETDLDRMDAEERGAARPDVAWICTDRDVWHANPFYKGEPVPHPEDGREYGAYEDEDDEDRETPIQWGLKPSAPLTDADYDDCPF